MEGAATHTEHLMRSIPLTVRRARRLRREMTLPEVILWRYLRNRAVGAHFRRQHPVGPYILDFYCSSARLCVEIDGQTHGTPDAQRYDDARTAWLESQGIRVLRFAASDVLNDDHLEGVLRLIEQAAAPSTA